MQFFSRVTQLSRYSVFYAMKRTATEPLDGKSNLKQMKLFEKKDGTGSYKRIEASWKQHGDPVKGLKPLMYMVPKEVKGSTKIAAFDMDGTLVTTKSGAKFPKGPSDWKFLSNKVPSKLKTLHSEGFKIVVFTNQAGIEKQKQKSKDIESKMLDIMNNLGFPIQAFASTGFNLYRKPYTSVWDFFVSNLNGGVDVDLNNSFFVGDAAGRPKDWQKGKPKDHSCDDRKFAANVGLRFHTPEEFFEDEKSFSRFEWMSINPRSLVTNVDKTSQEDYHANETEMIILVGYPASGKSTFAKRNLAKHDYVIVNRDTLKTQDKCEKAVIEALKAKKSVVVDNTNPGKDARSTYIKLAEKLNVPARCFYFETSIEAAKHMNLYRQVQTRDKVRRIPDVGYNVFKSRFVMPLTIEGFSEVKKIPFVPKFDSEDEKALFLKWT